MVKNILMIFVLAVLYSCSPMKQINQSKDNNIYITINDGHKIKNGETILFKIENISIETISIYHPTKIYIEKIKDGSWKKLRVLYCPCDAPCTAPPEKEKLMSHQHIEQQWDQNESWCDQQTDDQIRNSVHKFAGKGQYRIQINYENPKGEKTTTYKYFRL